MNAKDYEEVLEALGMLGRRTTINNKLNKVGARSKDEKLRGMIADLLNRIPYTSINHQVMTLRDSKAVSTKDMETYCRDKLGRNLYQEPKSVI